MVYYQNTSLECTSSCIRHLNNAVSASGLTTGYTYNGLGDRLSQFKNGVTTHYTLDLNAGLTQVLQDGTNTYLYGVNRIAQVAETQTGYFLPDALGSVRQMTDAYGDITLTQSYGPYGEILYSVGTTATDYAFTGESYDPQTGLVYLRARYYNPSNGRFTSRDTWVGDVNTPLSYNLWAYGYDNPVRYSDPSGFCPDDDGDGKCDQPITNLCYPTHGNDYLACNRIVHGFSPHANISNAELLVWDNTHNTCLGNIFTWLTKLHPLDLAIKWGMFEEYGYWYHYLLEKSSGLWNNNGKDHTSFEKVVNLAFTLEATDVGDYSFRIKLAEAFARKMFGESNNLMYQYIGSRAVVMNRVNPAVGPEGENLAVFCNLTNSDITDYASFDAMNSSMTKMILAYGQSAWSQVLHDAPYDYAFTTKDNPLWLRTWINNNGSPGFEEHQIYATLGRNSNIIGYFPVAYILTKGQTAELCGNKSCANMPSSVKEPWWMKQ